jgi:ParB/RepB/Spo0J family partition protein
VKELGDDWQLEEADRSVMYPHLHVVSDSDDASAESVQEILPFAQDFRRIPLANIREPEQRVRQKYDKQELFDLGNSMMHDGMIYPVIVEMVSENFYEIIIGSRRVRAARIREMTDIPALVVGPQSPLTRIIMALAENIHRVNLDPFEEAKVFLRLMKEYDIDTNEVAQKVRRSPHYVRERIQLLSLPEDVQQLVSDGELSLGNAIVLARLPEKERQKKLAQASLTHRFAPNELRRKIAGEISEMEKPGRVIPYRVTPEKFTARTEEFVRWFKRATPQLVLDGSTLDERVMMMNALASLENQIGKMKDVIKKGKSVSKRRAKK